MDLKNALAVCLISLFSASLVVMIARALDLQTASRLEPQLASIVEELQAIRMQGGLTPTRAAGIKAETADGLVVYYFHSNTRCPTCQSIESQSHQTVQSDFKPQLGRGELVWKVVNYEQPAGVALATKFEIQMPVVVLAKMKAGQVQDWKRLDEVWGLVDDKPAFAAYLRQEIQQMLGAEREALRPPAQSPESRAPAQAPAKLPLPATAPSLPLPK